MMSSTLVVVRRVLRNWPYRIGFALLSAAFVALLFQLQVATIPGNSIRMQLALFGITDWLLLVTVSTANALFLVMQWYTFRLERAYRRSPALLGGVAVGGLGTSSGVLASVFGTATCGLCATALFGFLGTNAVLFMVNNKDIIVLGSIMILLLSIVLVSRRFADACASCKIPEIDIDRP